MTAPHAMKGSTAPIHATRRAFSLIELLVVITIIAIVIAITVPSIGAARDLARGTSAKSQIQSLTSAVASFQVDNERVPGYFNAADMSENDDGLTGMQNLILDLAGGVVPGDGPNRDTQPPGTIEVGPNMDAQAFVNTALIGIDGTNSKSYLQADGVDFQTVEGKAGVDNADNLLVPEIVDPWGMPILAWLENEFAPELSDLEPSDVEMRLFAAETENGAPAPARFYWEQNRPILESIGLGEREISQSDSVLNAMDKTEVLAALCASPASPINTASGSGTPNVEELVPSISKGGVIFQSAGRDRVYLSTEDRGYRTLGGQFTYANYFAPSGTGALGANPWSDADGENGRQDIVDLFNDIVTASPR